MLENPLLFKSFHTLQDYQTIFDAMRTFTQNRSTSGQDEIWFLEHPPVFTQGQAGKAEHIINTQNIPVIQSDRGGQVTYHGPGQLMIYVLWDIKALHLGVRKFVTLLETVVIDLLADFQILAHRLDNAPGIYVENRKIASLGLRIKKGCSYHGISLNVDMDLTPFQYINPCGYKGLEMVQIKDWIPNVSIEQVKEKIQNHLLTQYLKQQNLCPTNA